MTTMPATRLFSVRAAEQLSTLHARCVECGFCLAVDFSGYRSPGAFWLVQVFNIAESVVFAGRGDTLDAAVAEAHDRFLATTMDL